MALEKSDEEERWVRRGAGLKNLWPPILCVCERERTLVQRSTRNCLPGAVPPTCTYTWLYLPPPRCKYTNKIVEGGGGCRNCERTIFSFLLILSIFKVIDVVFEAHGHWKGGREWQNIVRWLRNEWSTRQFVSSSIHPRPTLNNFLMNQAAIWLNFSM